MSGKPRDQQQPYVRRQLLQYFDGLKQRSANPEGWLQIPAQQRDAEQQLLAVTVTTALRD